MLKIALTWSWSIPTYWYLKNINNDRHILHTWLNKDYRCQVCSDKLQTSFKEHEFNFKISCWACCEDIPTLTSPKVFFQHLILIFKYIRLLEIIICLLNHINLGELSQWKENVILLKLTTVKTVWYFLCAAMFLTCQGMYICQQIFKTYSRTYTNLLL